MDRNIVRVLIALGAIFAAPSASAHEADVYNLDHHESIRRAKVINRGSTACGASVTTNNMILSDAECVKEIMPPYYNEDSFHRQLDINVRIVVEDETNSTYSIHSVLKIFFFNKTALMAIEPNPVSTGTFIVPQGIITVETPEVTDEPLLDPSTLRMTNFLRLRGSSSVPLILDRYFEEFPRLNKSHNFVVQILRDDSWFKEHICDGSIIARDVVLSAAECIKNIMPHDKIKETPYYLILDLKVKLATDEESRYEVTRIIHHDHLMLLKLKTQIPENAELVELFGPGEVFKKYFLKPILLTRGIFGRFANIPHRFQDITSNVTILTVPSRYCSKTLVTNSTFICAKQMVDGEYMSYCPTHLGGPIMIGERQVGVIAFLRQHGPWEHCFQADEYEAYPSVVGARGWIDSNIQLLREEREVTDPNDFDIHVVP